MQSGNSPVAVLPALRGDGGNWREHDRGHAFQCRSLQLVCQETRACVRHSESWLWPGPGGSSCGAVPAIQLRTGDCLSRHRCLCHGGYRASIDAADTPQPTGEGTAAGWDAPGASPTGSPARLSANTEPTKQVGQHHVDAFAGTEKLSILVALSDRILPNGDCPAHSDSSPGVLLQRRGLRADAGCQLLWSLWRCPDGGVLVRFAFRPLRARDGFHTGVPVERGRRLPSVPDNGYVAALDAGPVCTSLRRRDGKCHNVVLCHSG